MNEDILVVIVALCVCAVVVATIIAVIKFAHRQEMRRQQNRTYPEQEHWRGADSTELKRQEEEDRQLEERLQNTEIPPPMAEEIDDQVDPDEAWKGSRQPAPRRTLTEPFISGGIDTVIRHEYPCGLIVEYDGNGTLLNCIVGGKPLVDEIPGKQ